MYLEAENLGIKFKHYSNILMVILPGGTMTVEEADVVARVRPMVL